MRAQKGLGFPTSATILSGEWRPLLSNMRARLKSGTRVSKRPNVWFQKMHPSTFGLVVKLSPMDPYGIALGARCVRDRHDLIFSRSTLVLQFPDLFPKQLAGALALVKFLCGLPFLSLLLFRLSPICFPTCLPTSFRAQGLLGRRRTSGLSPY